MTTSEMQEQFLKEQNELRDRIVTSDTFDPCSLRLVAGVDLAYWKNGDDEFAVCCIVVIDIDTHEIVEKRHCSGKIEVPYMPGFLAYTSETVLLAYALKFYCDVLVHIICPTDSTDYLRLWIAVFDFVF